MLSPGGDIEVRMGVACFGEEDSVLSAWRVVYEETDEESLFERDEEREVVLEVGECRPGGWRYVGAAADPLLLYSERCCDRIVWAILSSLNGLRRPFSEVGCSIGRLHSSTVLRIAVVISSRLVYGKQTFRTALLLRAVSFTALSTASSTSGLTSSRWPRIRMLAPYRSRSSPCSDSCVSFILAMSIRASTSYFERLKFSMLNA